MSFGQVIVLILILVSVNSQFYAMGVKPKEMRSEQSHSASCAATCYSYSFESPFNDSELKMLSSTDRVETSYKLFELYPDRFHMGNPRQELVLKGIESGCFSLTVSFKQAYNGVDILGSDVTVHYAQPRRVPYTVTGTYCGNISLSTTPQIDSTEAHELAILAYREWAHSPPSESLSFSFPSVRLTIWRSEHDKMYLIWVVRLIWQLLPDRVWEYYINAHDGTVLREAEYNNY